MRWAATHTYALFLHHPPPPTAPPQQPPQQQQQSRPLHLYESQQRVIHAKTIVVDGLYSALGSYNLDPLSANKLLECNVAMLSPPLAQAMTRQFQLDVARCRPVTAAEVDARGVLERVLHWAAFHVGRWLVNVF
jgi:cardiolipin synthase